MRRVKMKGEDREGKNEGGRHEKVSRYLRKHRGCLLQYATIVFAKSGEGGAIVVSTMICGIVCVYGRLSVSEELIEVVIERRMRCLKCC